MSQQQPFSSARLIYRAVCQPADLPVFQAINDDQIGYQNSNAGNIKLAGPADAEKFMKETAEESLFGAVIWLPQPPILSTEEVQKLKGRLHHEIHGHWGVAIGEIHLSRLPPHMAHHRSTEIGLDILPMYQGKGYGAEAIDFALDYAFRRAGLHRVRVRAFGWNEGAIRLYKKLGFVMEGCEREALWHEGKWWDGLEMGMLEREWKAREEEKGRVFAESSVSGSSSLAFRQTESD